jgi:hypothetical protein
VNPFNFHRTTPSGIFSLKVKISVGYNARMNH